MLIATPDHSQIHGPAAKSKGKMPVIAPTAEATKAAPPKTRTSIGNGCSRAFLSLNQNRGKTTMKNAAPKKPVCRNISKKVLCT